MLKTISTMLLVVILLGLLTGCKTTLVYYVPSIEEPIIEDIPTHEPWEFTAIDENNFLLSEEDLTILSKYIVNLKTWGNAGWTWVDYYIKELQRYEDKILVGDND